MFTTHSNDALRPLPDKAIWAAVGGQLFQGKLDIASLRAISGQVDSKLVIFVEDTFAKAWVEEMLRFLPDVALDAVSVHAMEGDDTAVKVCRSHNLDPSVQQPAICLIDGNSEQAEAAGDGIFRLPGQSPESFIYDEVMAKLDSVAGELPVALLRPYEEHQKVVDVVRSVRNTNRDSHLLYSQAGKALGLLPEMRVRDAFLATWARTSPSIVAGIADQFRTKLPLNTDEQPLTQPL